jgi:hypothetical protein
LFLSKTIIPCIVTTVLLSFHAWAGEPVRLFVEPFANKAGAAQLRSELVNLLRKEHGIAVINEAASADFILSGTGETYIKGYVGTNPRVRYLNSDAKPVYGGFLSVELKNREHDPVWSSLATPRRFGSDDINRNLAGQIVHKLAVELEQQRKPAKP